MRSGAHLAWGIDVSVPYRPTSLAVGLVLVSWLIVSGALASEHKVLDYAETAATDAIARLQKRLEAGEVSLEFEAKRGYLPSLLRALDVPVSSQGLVFSRTSLQVDRIAPWTPRAIYFNDDVYVGWVQTGPVIEIASVDPVLGAVFYTLAQDGTDAPEFVRQTGTCLMCHDSTSVTGGVPGFVVRSVHPDRYGYAISVKERPTSDRTPMAERWGGWYVTGSHGDQKHLGNVVARELTHEVGNVSRFLQTMDYSTGGNVMELTDRFDTSAYLSPHSDIVSLMVLAHQATVHNLVTRAGYETRKALYDESLLKKSPDAPLSPLTLARVEHASDALVRALLFANEVPLTSPVTGTSRFAEEFARRGPRDEAGRSLRELDLERRLFRYPLSFLIYGEAFDALPAVTKDYIFRRLHEVLSGAGEEDERFAHLSPSDRKAIFEILTATKPGFPFR